MSSSHYRSASATERRSATANGMHTRTGSTRMRDYERPSVRENGSPVLLDAFENVSDVASVARKFQLHERRRERTTTTTTESQYTRHSPVRDNLRAVSRNASDRLRQSLQSPVIKKSSKEVHQDARK